MNSSDKIFEKFILFEEPEHEHNECISCEAITKLTGNDTMSIKQLETYTESEIRAIVNKN